MGKTIDVSFRVGAIITDAQSSINTLKNSLKDLTLPENQFKATDKILKSIYEDMDELRRISKGDVLNVSNMNKADKLYERISSSIEKLNEQTENIEGLDPKKILPDEINNKIKEFEKNVFNLQKHIQEGFDTQQIKLVNKELEKAQNQLLKYEELQKQQRSYSSKAGAQTAKITKATAELKTVEEDSQRYKELTEQIKRATEERQKFLDLSKQTKDQIAKDFPKEKVDGYRASVEQLTNRLKVLNEEEKKTAFKNISREIEQFKGLAEGSLNITSLEQLKQIIETLPIEKVQQLGLMKPFEEWGKGVSELNPQVKQLEDNLEAAKQEGTELTEKAKDLEHIANQVKQFFSIGNTVQLFKRAIRSAFETIKDLDAVMTQTAVVTDFSVGDMWAQLPEYTKRANELGVSVKGAYEAATLYYQQGLETNQVMGVSNETLKMAKIAAIDYATATDYMTSALRGFNMEVNEDSARKVNDIYSQLAAKTAADTEEISIAMSKTAPLAHNAGMEIETTAALLSQMIETTREAPETLGTAMKTVIARFQELKKDPALIEPVEGEIVDANKIEGALRTIGVALRDTSGQFRDLDDVFLEISQKWNSLDTNTQRYIATIAAGSRQQSRFIAMMANYDRTMELVEYANNSAGASQKQFEKTLDSMQSKLDRLKNAWNEFTMGLANNSVIKTIVDLLTDLLNIINKISSGVSGNNGILKSLVDIGILMGGLKMGKAAFTGFFGWLQGKSKVEGQALGGNLFKGITNIFSKDKKGINIIGSVSNWLDRINGKLSPTNEVGELWAAFYDDDSFLIDEPFKWSDILNFPSFSDIKKKITDAFTEIKKNGEKAGEVISKAFGLIPGPLKIAIPLAIALGAAIYKIAKDNSIEERIKKAEESTKRAEEAANQAKEAYDNLLEEKSKYSELQNTLDNLTYGTTAWKEALIEANGQVLELLQTFPQLVQYLQTGTNGRLQISTEGWDAVIEQQEEAIRRTTNNLLGAQISEINLQNEKLYKDLGKTTGILNRKVLDELINQYEKNPQFFIKNEQGEYNKDLNALAFRYNINPEKLYDAQNAIKEYEAAIQSNNTTISGYVQNLISNNAKIKDLEPELIDSFTKAYSDKISDNYEIKVQGEAGRLQNYNGMTVDENGKRTTYLDQVLSEYGLEITGTTKKKLTELYKYLANITGEEINDGILGNKKAMAEAIARMRFGDEIQSNINDIIDLVQKDTSGGVQKILDVFGGELGKFESADLKTLQDSFSKKDATAATVFSKLGFKSQEAFEEAIKAMGYTMTNANGEIIADFESFRQAFLDGVIDLTEGIRQAKINLAQGLYGAGFNEADVKAILGYLNNEQSIAYSNFIDKTSTLNTDTKNKIYGEAFTLLGSTDTSKQTIELLNSIDFSRPTESIIALQEATHSGIKELENFANEILSFDQLSIDKAFKDFAMSDEYSQMEESLKDFIKTNGKLNSQNIKSLAKENYKLNNLLKLETINASGLARALTAVSQGKIGFEELNTSMLKALSSMVTIEDKYSELSEYFNNIDEGYDSNAYTKKYSGYAENLLELASQGLTGDNQFQKQTDLLFGEGFWEEKAKQGQEGIDELISLINERSQWLSNNGVGFWSMVAQDDKDLDSIDFYVDEAGNVAGQIKETFSGTIDDIISELATAYEIPEELANALIQSYASMSPEFQIELNMAAARNAFNEFIGEIEQGESKVVSENQLQVWADALGMDIETLRQQLTDTYKDSIHFADWFTTDGMELKGAELQAKMQEVFGNDWNLEEALGVTYDTHGGLGEPTKTVTYEVAIKYAADNNLTQEQLDSLLKENDIQVTDEVGVVVAADTTEYEAQIEAANTQEAGDLLQKAQDAIDGLNWQSIYDNMDTKAHDGLLAGGGRAISELAQSFSGTSFTATADITGHIHIDQDFALGTYAGRKGVSTQKTQQIQKRFLGGRPAFASGTNFGSLKHDEIALTGEEGYELAYNDNGAFLLGANGPEVTKLDKGTVIYPHDLSKKILSGYSKSIFPNYKTGTIPNYYNPGERSFTSNISVVSITSTDYSEAASNLESMTESAKELKETSEDITEETEKWENTVDFLYNMTQKVNQELRVRDKLERQYNRLLKTHTGTGEELRRLTNEEIVSLKKRQDMQREMIELRKKELHAYMMLNKEMMKYAIIDNWDDMTIHIAWDSINNITDKDEYDRAVDFLHRLEEVQGTVQDLEDDIEDIEDELTELKERGKDQYRDLEDRVLAALISEQQEIIDEQEKTNKAIKDAESSLIDAIQKNIDKMRQDRDNEEKESSIAEKERRLAYLRQDTTGSNALEIKKLEDELAKEKQDYSDTLIDQALKDLKEQNDEAQKQREKQIELAQSQLDEQIKTGAFADEATRIVREGLGPNGIMDRESRLYKLLYEQEEVITNSNASRDKWDEDLANSISEAFVWLYNVLDQKNNGSDVVESMKQNSQSWMTASSSEQSNLHAENQRLAREYEAATGEKLTYNSSEGAWYKENGERLYTVSKDEIAHDVVAKMRQNSNAWGNASESKQKELAAENVELAERLENVLGQDIIKKDGVWYIGTRKLYDVYEKGGLADFTGPAWLDGTKSKPEMVLNAKDTQNFIQLKDILAGLRSGIVGNQGQSGDWYFDIDINVDEIANDYDVDKVADRVKQAIYKETTYRNVNAINFLK